MKKVMTVKLIVSSLLLFSPSVVKAQEKMTKGDKSVTSSLGISSGKHVFPKKADLTAAAMPFQVAPSSVAGKRADEVSLSKEAKERKISAFPSRHSRKASDKVAEVPFFDDFNEDIDARYTVIDANADERTWMWDSDTFAAFYRFSPKNSGDDWLITPPVRLEAGKKYVLNFCAYTAGLDFSERFEVKWGKGATVADMTEELVEETEVTSTNHTTFSRTVAPTKDGNYHFGFHAISNANSFYLYVDSISIENAMDPMAPGVVTHLKAAANPEGKLQATVTFIAPSLTVDGSPLKAIDSIEVKRNGVVMATIKTPEPASEQVVTDDKVVQGVNTYTVTTYNSCGKGMKADVAVYVGVDEPTVPNVKAQDHTKSIKLVWDDVKGNNGGFINPASVVYDIYDVTHGAAMAGKIGSVTGTNEYEITGLNTDQGNEQNYLTYGVTALNEAGKSAFGISSVIVGKPYTLPYHNSLKNSTSEGKFIGLEREDGFNWGVMKKGSYDSDGGTLAFTSTAAASGSLLFGKMDVRGCKNPTLVFWYKADAACPARLSVDLQYADNTIDAKVWTVDFTERATDGWEKAVVSLPASTTEKPYFILRLRGIATDNLGDNLVFIDNINVIDPEQKDAAVELTAPKGLKKGQKAKLKVMVSNRGLDKMVDPVLKVTVNNEQIYNKKIDRELATLEYAGIELDYQTSTVNSANRLDIKAEVLTDGDLNTANNVAITVVELSAVEVASPTDLKATVGTEESVVLEWNAPAVTYGTMTDDFENYDAWSTDFGTWTTIDADGGYAGKMSKVVSLPHENEQYAFMNWQPSDFFESSSGVNPLSGTKAAVAFYQYDENGKYVDADNYMITPRLSGRNQTVTFHVNNATNEKGTSTETFAVLVSETGKDKNDFRQLGDDREQWSGTWEKVSVDVPEGTQYLAIHHKTKSYNALIFMVDDVTFEPSSAPESYRIYRDGKWLAEVTEVKYTDKENKTDGKYQYQVTAVYADGSESKPIETVVVTDVMTLEAETPGFFNVYSLDGKCVLKNSDSLKGLEPGIYIINGRKTVVKQ